MARSAAEHVARIEIDDDILPGLVFRDRKEAVGRAACAPRATRFRPRPGTPDGCRCSSAAARPTGCRPVELDADRHDQIARLGGADRHVPALAQPRAQRVELVLRQRRGLRRVAVPSDGVLLSVCRSRRAAAASRLSSSAAMRWVEFRLRASAAGFFGGFGVSAFFSGFCSGFVSSFFSASAIGSSLRLGSLAKACFGSGLGSGGFGRRRFFGSAASSAPARACGCSCSAAATISGLSDDLGARILDRLRVGDLLDQRLRRLGSASRSSRLA